MTRLEEQSLVAEALNQLSDQIRAMRLEIKELRASLKKKRKQR